jgi:hypothetical protein
MVVAVASTVVVSGVVFAIFRAAAYAFSRIFQ